MPAQRKTNTDFTENQPDIERDQSAKGGPSAGLGNPDDKHGVSAPYDEDLQTQIAAKGKKKKIDKKDTK